MDNRAFYVNQDVITNLTKPSIFRLTMLVVYVNVV